VRGGGAQGQRRWGRRIVDLDSAARGDLGNDSRAGVRKVASRLGNDLHAARDGEEFIQNGAKLGANGLEANFVLGLVLLQRAGPATAQIEHLGLGETVFFEHVKGHLGVLHSAGKRISAAAARANVDYDNMLVAMHARQNN